MYIKKTVLALLLVAVLLLGGAGVILVGKLGVSNAVIISKAEYEDYAKLSKNYGMLEYIRNYVERNYFVDVDSSKLLEGAYKGMVAGLEDPYSEYVTAEAYNDYLSSMLGEYSGVGMSFYGNADDVLEVVQVYRNSPASKAGMQAGDIILEVDGKSFKGSESSEAASNIRGKAGTSVTITYSRDGVVGTVTMVRQNITVETVSGKMMEDGIAYIAIDSFESGTAVDFKEILGELTEQGAKALIIDLRNNGGGLVNIAVEIADELMNQATVVYTEDHDKNRHYYQTSAGRTELPYVLLVNEYTASASEILSAGIQDNKEGIIVGTVTYGKGIIQSLDRMPDGSAVKLTQSQYFSPSGKTIHKVGITPDYIVELVEGDDTDYQLQKAIEVLK